MTEERFRQWLWKVPEGGFIGKRVRLKDGYEKASGKGSFTRDVYRPGMLYAKLVRCPYCRAKVKSLDTTKAKALPGVWDVMTYKDLNYVPTGSWPFSMDRVPKNINGDNLENKKIDLLWFNPGPWLGNTYGPEWKVNKTSQVDENGPMFDPLSKVDVANWPGQPIAVIVVAESEEICDKALKLVKVEWEELPWILDAEKALNPDAPVLFPEYSPDSNLRRELVTEYGDVAKGFKEADRIIEFKHDHAEIDLVTAEAGAAVAEWKGDHLEVWHHDQDPKWHAEDTLQRYTEANKINVHVLHNGGIFGGFTHSGIGQEMTVIATVAAKRTGRPVKALYDHSHFHSLEEGYGVFYYKVGFKNNGKITAVKQHYIGTCLMGPVIGKLRDATCIPNLHCTESVPFVNRGPVGPQRAGGAECTIVTAVFEHVAGELGVDPTKIAEINDGCEGKDMAWVNENVKKPQGFDPTRDSLKEIMDAGKKAINWDKKWHPPGTKKLPNGKYHGIGCMWIESWNNYAFIPRKVGLVLRHDGTINITTRTAECGTHRVTTYPQVVAAEIGMLYEDVYCRASEDYGFDFAPLGGSSGMLWNIPPLVRASRKMKQLLLEYAVKPRLPNLGPLFPNKKSEELDIKNSEIFVKENPANIKPVAALAAFFSDVMYVWDVAEPNTEKKYKMARQAYFVEVEVDPDTGETDVKKMIIARDCGKVINPDSCDQQLYGVYQGVGRSNTEAIYHDPQTGVKLNDNLIDYPQLTMNDIGSIDIRKIETGLGYGPYGLLGIGESSACCTCAITGPAIFNAIGKHIDSYPTTPDKVLKALGKA